MLKWKKAIIMIRAIIIDDEISCVETLEIELKAYCPIVKVIAKNLTAKEGLEAIKEMKPDVVFLDVEMPHMNAFDLLEQCHDLDFNVIFVTAYDQYAIRAFDFNAADYLLKPVQKAKLIQAVEKIQNQQESAFSHAQLKAIVTTIQNSITATPNIALPTVDGFEFVRIEKIVYAQADSNYTHIHLITGKKFILSRTLKEVESMLMGHHFIRIHQSNLINLSHIAKYIKGAGGYVVMRNGDTLNVSRGHKAKLLELIKGD